MHAVCKVRVRAHKRGRPPCVVRLPDEVELFAEVVRDIIDEEVDEQLDLEPLRSLVGREVPLSLARNVRLIDLHGDLLVGAAQLRFVDLRDAGADVQLGLGALRSSPR